MSQVDGVSMCYHKTNLCDLHPVCDNAEDEDEIKCAESEKYKEEFKKGATFRCQSLYHNEDTVKANLSKAVLWIKAVPQDGIPECWNNEDELPTNPYKTYGIPGNILHYLLTWIPEKLVIAADV